MVASAQSNGRSKSLRSTSAGALETVRALVATKPDSGAAVAALRLAGGDVGLRGRAYAILAPNYVTTYALDRGEMLLQLGLDFVREHDLPMYHHYLLSHWAVLHLLRGRLSQALELAQSFAWARGEGG